MIRSRFVRLLSGSPQHFSLEHRVFNLFAIIGILLSLTSILCNYLLHLNVFMMVVPLLFSAMIGWVYYLSRVKGRLRIPAAFCVVGMLFFAPAVWMANGGSMGGAQYFLLVFCIIVAILYSGRTRTAILILYFAVIIGLFAFEYWHPEMIKLYDSRADRYLDVMFGFNLSALAIALLFIVLADSYRSEHERVKQYSQHLEEIATTDGQTGLLNHRFAFTRLEEEIAKARRYERKLSIIMLDIDHFKILNDTQGHQYGDYVLTQIADILKNSIRTTDSIGRYGGEEFLIICPETGLAEVYLLGNRLRTLVERESFRREMKVTISGGVAELHNDTAVQLVEKADRCLYTAKHMGRNRIGM
ncbi:MAG TPA: GGDEF domain-containing protein [Syntrophomonadaceae bacterium]|nr:GGDEF domain-containing protein [Syntrophomonadaceae bacterium]